MRRLTGPWSSGGGKKNNRLAADSAQLTTGLEEHARDARGAYCLLYINASDGWLALSNLRHIARIAWSDVCCATLSILYRCVRHCPLSGEERVSRNESRSALPTTPNSAPLFRRRSLSTPLRTSEPGRLVLLLPNRHAAGDRSPLSVSVYLCESPGLTL